MYSKHDKKMCIYTNRVITPTFILANNLAQISYISSIAAYYKSKVADIDLSTIQAKRHISNIVFKPCLLKQK